MIVVSSKSMLFNRIYFFIVLLISLPCLNSCSEKKKEIIAEKQIIEINCDLEDFNKSNFICSNGDEITGAKWRTDEFSRSGKYSVKISSKRNYALHFKYSPIELGDEVIVSVWKLKGNPNAGAIGISTGKAKTYYLIKETKTEGNWEYFEKYILINREPSDSLLDILAFNSKEKPVYYDDLKIKIIKHGGYALTNHPELDQIALTIKSKNIEKLKEVRKDALKTKVLISESDDWVKAKINWNGDSEKCKVRLKGDWTDHLLGKKWSLRINISNDKKINGYTRFSIQNPLSRGYLLEWLSHKIFIDEDVLTTRFGFANVKINNELKGMYSVEEHFTDELLISQNRKKGVIIKFDEGPMWEFRKAHHKKKEGIPQWYKSAEIIPFSKKKVFADKSLRNDYLKARDKLYQFQQYGGDINEIFDLDKMARFLALIDIFKSYHGLIWHNLRFYYNPESEKLEPIAYDLFTEYDPPKTPYPGFMGYNFLIGQNLGMYYEFRDFFKNPVFFDKYITYLERYTSPDFIDNLLDESQSEIDFYGNELRKEYRFYRFESHFLYENAKTIREKLPELIKNKEKLISSQPFKGYKINPGKLTYPPVNNESLKAYVSIQNKKAKIQLQNYYYKSLIVTGYITGSDTLYLDLDKQIKLAPLLNTGSNNTKSLNIEFLVDKIIYKVDGETIAHYQITIPFRAPE